MLKILNLFLTIWNGSRIVDYQIFNKDLMNANIKPFSEARFFIRLPNSDSHRGAFRSPMQAFKWAMRVL